MHIADAKRIGWRNAHLQIHLLQRARLLLMAMKHPRQPIAPKERKRSARAASIFPFRLGGQAEIAAGALAEPLAIVHGIVPRHIGHRLVVGGAETVLATQCAVLRHKLLKLSIGDLSDSHAKRVRQIHPMHRSLVVVFALAHRAHPEVAFFDGFYFRNIYLSPSPAAQASQEHSQASKSFHIVKNG